MHDLKGRTLRGGVARVAQRGDLNDPPDTGLGACFEQRSWSFNMHLLEAVFAAFAQDSGAIYYGVYVGQAW